LDENKYIADNVNRGEGNFNISLRVIKSAYFVRWAWLPQN